MTMHSGMSRSSGRVGSWVAATLTVWAMSVVVLSLNGFYASLKGPQLAGFIAAGIILPVIAYFTVHSFQSYVKSVGLGWITAFHIWRIPAALVFFWYGAQGQLPELFVRNAAWGDLAAGALALIVTLLPARRWRYWTVHLFGFADFITAVGTGLTLTLLKDPLMAGVSHLPVSLIPLFGVGISGATHIMAFHILLSSRNTARQA